jgi:hypothetical protein
LRVRLLLPCIVRGSRPSSIGVKACGGKIGVDFGMRQNRSGLLEEQPQNLKQSYDHHNDPNESMISLPLQEPIYLCLVLLRSLYALLPTNKIPIPATTHNPTLGLSFLGGFTGFLPDWTFCTKAALRRRMSACDGYQFDIQVRLVGGREGVCKLCPMARSRPLNRWDMLTILRSPRQPISNDCKSSKMIN